MGDCLLTRGLRSRNVKHIRIPIFIQSLRIMHACTDTREEDDVKPYKADDDPRYPKIFQFQSEGYFEEGVNANCLYASHQRWKKGGKI
jgi:hypothetical protein